jgi:hypothetical protein
MEQQLALDLGKPGERATSSWRGWDYVYICAGCGLLEYSEQPDTLTCSPECEERYHRDSIGVKVTAAQLQRDAVECLCPDIAKEVLAGRVNIEEVRRDIYLKFIKLAFEQAAMS